jgi:hypothetical protein
MVGCLGLGLVGLKLLVREYHSWMGFIHFVIESFSSVLWNFVG